MEVFMWRQVLISVLLIAGSVACAAERPRLAVLTDIGGDPDDQQSLIRLLVYANQFDIELLLASASGTRGELKDSVTRTDLILETIRRYEQVLPKLRQHESNWPDADTLREKVKSGNRYRGREHIGEGHDSAGSQALIAAVDAGSVTRPLNITVWGGQTDLAQALWSVKHLRGSEGLKTFISRLRVYDINDQDGIANWMRQEFPGMYYILASAPAGQDKRLGTYRGMYLTGDPSLTSLQWIDANVRSMGLLGEAYPVKTWTAPNPHSCLKEGDTPSWFFFLSKGGNNPNDPTQPGWGGQFRRAEDGWYEDLPVTDNFDPRTTVSRWRPDFQTDFALRMSWCK
ncbi:MAG: DUF1593 domain-containing protein [Pirellulaceae bacterium]|nr:DUF1593 domain-containing protein [Pirellulaceae bacterium]